MADSFHLGCRNLVGCFIATEAGNHQIAYVPPTVVSLIPSDDHEAQLVTLSSAAVLGANSSSIQLDWCNSMLSHSFTFVHPADEEAFLLSYSKAGVFIDVAAASVGLVAVLLKAIGRSILLKQPTAADDTAAPPTSNWYIEITRFTLCIWTILAFAVLGRRRYTLIRGPASVIHRVVYALGLPLTVRPGLCR